MIAVFTATDFPEIKPICADFDKPGFVVAQRPALASDHVRFVGDAIAMVIASDPYAAADAVELIEVEYDQLPSVSDGAMAVRPDAPLLYSHVAKNVIYEGSFELPDFASNHERAEFKLRETYSAARIAAVPISSRAAASRVSRKASIDLLFGRQPRVPDLARAVIAEYLELPESDVRIIAADVGGGFGAKTVVYPEEILVCAAAMRLGRPVKWIEDRYENMLTCAQARDHTYEIEISFDRNGVVSSLSADILVNIGAYPSLPMGSSSQANGASRTCPARIR